jgi:two-component system chemotaxis response regulator CheY
MRILIAEDDFVSRRLLAALLAPFGSCDVTVNGQEAVDAFRRSLADNRRYDLVCLDIMMPVLDGQQALGQIRTLEQEHGIWGLAGTKIIMTTALDDPQTVLLSFRQQCEVYLVKPLDENLLYRHLLAFGFRPVLPPAVPGLAPGATPP